MIQGHRCSRNSHTAETAPTYSVQHSYWLSNVESRKSLRNIGTITLKGKPYVTLHSSLLLLMAFSFRKIAAFVNNTRER